MLKDGETYRMILGDALAVLPTLEGIDAVVTDVPYGLGDGWHGGFNGRNGRSKVWPTSPPKWDVLTPALVQAVEALPALSPHVIVWGGHYYSLPPSRCWLVWDKLQEFSSADCELAWTNLAMPARVFRMSRIDAHHNKADCRKSHPNQKPTALMRWCLSFLPEGCTVLDPFMGSGTTGVACLQTGRRFVGIEIDPAYHAVAVKRLAEAADAAPLFNAPLKQAPLFAEG